MSSASSEVYFGELTCQGKHVTGKKAGQPCTNKAYYKQGSRYLCGTHSSGHRKKLRKNPHAMEVKDEKLKKLRDSVTAAAAGNQKAGVPGQVMCSKIGMMRAPEDVEGFLKVFPNYKHQNRKDGFGCASLSPMSLGPVEHHQKGLPVCQCLENYHQFNKVYNVELGKDKKPSQVFYSAQLSGYKSSTPQRRKYTSKSKIAAKAPSGKLSTLFSIHRDSEGTEKRYSYIQSRYFYCHFYEKLCRENKDLQKLKTMLKAGTNLQIVGYDGYNVTKDLMYHYLDTSRPFGHELVLYTLLTMTDPKEYPWNNYYETHPGLYPAALKPEYLDTIADTSGNSKSSADKGRK